MNNIQDLNIEKEIFPLFNYSQNRITRQKILQILETPLSSTTDIIKRQIILKGFIANNNILKDYSYSFMYFHEVYSFLTEDHIEDFSQNKLKYKILVSKRDKTMYSNKFNQMILLLNNLHINCFSKIDLKKFPKKYSLEIERIIDFLSELELEKYINLAHINKLKDNDIINLTKKINEYKSEERIILFWNDLFLFETYLSISLGIIKEGFTFPIFKEKGIKLTDFYHPLIKNPITNNFETTSNVIVLNGPNMSGKSTFLKSVGICVYFAHLGIAIPATIGEISFYHNFSIEINSKDNMKNGYSHFMTEVIKLKNIVENASRGEKCFAVFDELFNGTNVEDAFEICKTTIKGLSKYNNSLFLISTHIQELKCVSNEHISNYYIDCELVMNKPTFTYKLKKGWSDIKIGRILFEKEGLNQMLK